MEEVEEVRAQGEGTGEAGRVRIEHLNEQIAAGKRAGNVRSA